MAPEPFSKTVFHKVATEVQCSASSLLCTIHTGKGRGGRGQLSRTPHILFIFASAAHGFPGSPLECHKDLKCLAELGRPVID